MSAATAVFVLYVCGVVVDLATASVALHFLKKIGRNELKFFESESSTARQNLAKSDRNAQEVGFKDHRSLMVIGALIWPVSWFYKGRAFYQTAKETKQELGKLWKQSKAEEQERSQKRS